MLKKTVTYKNPFDDTSVTEDLYFNLSKAELTEMAMVEGDGFSERLQNLVKSNDGKTIMAEFKRLLGMAYGRRTDDGKFIKSPEISAEFLSSEAYSELFMELITKPGASAEFFNGIVPSDLDAVIASLPGDGDDARPAWVREDREPTQKELTSMTKAQLVEVMNSRVRKTN